MEHEVMASAAICGYRGPTHPCLDPHAPPPLLPTPPDPAVLSRCFVRCGVNQRMHAKEAVELALKPMLRKYHALLPRGRWRAVCMQAMRVSQAIADALAAHSAHPNPSTGNPTVAGDQKLMYEGNASGGMGGVIPSEHSGRAAVGATENTQVSQ